MTTIRLILAILFFAGMFTAALAAWKVWKNWARRTSSAMFYALLLTGVALACFLRLCGSVYAREQPVDPVAGLFSIMAIVAEAAATTPAALYALRLINGRWMRGQNGSRMMEISDVGKPSKPDIIDRPAQSVLDIEEKE